MTLREIGQGKEFKLGDIKFIKLDDNEKCFVITAEPIFESEFGPSDDFAKSVILERLEDEVLPQVEELVGANNVLEFESNLKSFDCRNKYANIKDKISIPSFEYYTMSSWLKPTTYPKLPYWISTSYQGACLSIGNCGAEMTLHNQVRGVRPLLQLNSNIEVQIESVELGEDEFEIVFNNCSNLYTRPMWTITN